MGFTAQNGTYHAFRKNIPISLHDFREASSAGVVGNIAANGGILASDTTPIMRGLSGTIAQEISWASSNNDPIVAQVSLPPDLDGDEDVHVECLVSSGTTNAASLTVETAWDNEDKVVDSAVGQATTAAHKTLAVISGSDIPDGASFLTLLLTPVAHTTNALNLHGVRVTYVPKTVAHG
jgi:hypothetical protein